MNKRQAGARDADVAHYCRRRQRCLAWEKPFKLSNETDTET